MAIAAQDHFSKSRLGLLGNPPLSKPMNWNHLTQGQHVLKALSLKALSAACFVSWELNPWGYGICSWTIFAGEKSL